MARVERPPYWNVWWTLTIISAVFTLVVLTLEALGILHDLGLTLSLAGLLMTALLGLSASTRSSLVGFRAEVVPRLERVDERLGRMDEHLQGILRLLDERLPRSAS